MPSKQLRIPMVFLMAIGAAAPCLLEASPQLPGLTRGATHETTTPDILGLTTETSQCAISDDATYGVTAENPIKVGGGAAYVMARSLGFLRSLRGPAGQGLHFKRLGSFDGPDDTILDVYLIEYHGAARHVYVDGYRWEAPKAPRGFLCGTAARVEPPGPDPFATQRQKLALAANIDAAAGPISLDPDGSARHGVVFDHVRLVARAVAEASKAGRALDLQNLPAEITKPQFVVVAYPAQCDGRATPPLSVTVTDVNGNSPKVLKQVQGDQIPLLLPGFAAPTSALAVMYGADLAIPGKALITYGPACAASPAVTLPLEGQGGRITHRVAGRAPQGVSLPPGGALVRVQVYFDFNGAPHFPTYAGGPETLAGAAVAAAGEFRADPPRVNGAPLLQPSTISIAFQP